MKERKPIFYDERRRRWRTTRRLLEISGGVLLVLLVTFLVSVKLQSESPALLPRARPALHALRSPQPAKTFQPRKGRRRRVASLGRIPARYDPLRAAFYVSWDPTSLASLQNNYRELDLLVPEELHAVSPDGSMGIVDPRTNQLKYLSPEGAVTLLQNDKLHTWMRATKTTPGTERTVSTDLPTMSLLNNYDGTAWHTKELAEMLANPQARERMVMSVIEYAVKSGQAGVVVDFEDVPERSQYHFRAFMAELGAGLHGAGLKLMVALPAADYSYDYAYFARETDAVILMNYDQHWLTSAPGPIAAQDWFLRNMENTLQLVPREKLIMGIANYAYDWPDIRRGKMREPAVSRSVQEALLTAYESESQVDFDSDSLNPHFSYYDEHNHIHHVWFLDALTAYNELRASERAGVRGTALWRLGTADQSLWAIWDKVSPDEATRAQLEEVPPGFDLILDGEGDIWRINATPTSGKRSFQYDASSDTFTDEDYEKYPLSYQIDALGLKRGKIALTFDDGPDPTWTPRILDILKQKGAPATFFVIGEEATQYADILKREYAEGHEIGNHTYLHPQFDRISHDRLVGELKLTRMLIESTLGVQTLLFRPPYGIDHQPETADEVAQLPQAQAMGYTLVGSWIDPHDWQRTAGQAPRPQEIAREVVEQAQQERGSIVLLHDGGGDRSSTIAALPLVIDELRAAGFQIVPVSELIGKTRDEVMPALTTEDRWMARADGAIFGMYRWFRLGIAWIFIVGIGLAGGRAIIIGLLALIERLRPSPAYDPEFTPRASIVIPAYNEEEVIVDTVRAALASDYPELEVVVVNDGSMDHTGELLDEQFGANPRVRIIHQANRGKPGALSRGLAESSGEIVVTIDADTEIEPDAVHKLARHFADARIGAVAGNVKVGNRARWLTRWQALEYITSQNLEKRAFDLLNCIPVVPGAVSAWRADAIRACGGFTQDTVAEDTDLTIALRRTGWRITYDEEAIGWTEAPETPGALIRQRFRWTYGTLQAVWKHRDTLGRPRYGTLGFIALPNVFIFQLLLPLFSPVIDLLFGGSLLLWGLAQFRITHVPQIWTAEDVERSLIFFAAFMLIDFLTCVIAFALERHEDWTLLWPLLIQRFYYRQMMYVVLFRALVQAVKGRPVGWRGVEPEVPASPVHA